MTKFRLKDFFLETERLHLRFLQIKENEELLKYKLKNNVHFKDALPDPTQDYFTIGFQKRLLQKEHELAKDMLFMRWFIFNKTDLSSIIGDINIGDIKLGNVSSCTMGIKIDKDNTQKGFAKEALQETIRFLFDNLGLHKIIVNILPRNKASLHLFEKLGFEKEGVSKHHMKINNKWEDHIQLSLINGKK